jgi:preprotein translocase subunit SecB
MDYLDKGHIEWKIDGFLEWAKTEFRWRAKQSDSPDIFFPETNQNYKLRLLVELKKKKEDEKDFPIVATVQLTANLEADIDADFIFSIVKVYNEQVILVLTITQSLQILLYSTIQSIKFE